MCSVRIAHGKALTSKLGILSLFVLHPFPTFINARKTNLVTQNTLKQATVPNMSLPLLMLSHQDTRTFDARGAPTWAKADLNPTFNMLDHLHFVAESILLVAFWATSGWCWIDVGVTSNRNPSFGYRTIVKIAALSAGFRKLSPSMTTRTGLPDPDLTHSVRWR